MSAARGLFGTPTLAPVLVALLLVSSMAATAVLAARGVVPVSSAALETSPSTHAVQLSQPSASGRPAVSACLRPVSEFPALWRGPWPPPAVAPTLQSPCAWGADESSLGFLSNQSGSADRASFTVLLPPSGTATGETLAALSFRIWASGMPCSLDGATQVEVQLIPPASPYGSSFSADWSVRAPAFDLVPPSSCDPTCSNDTAIFTIDGAAFCEDQIVRSAPGAPPTAPTGAFSPGDTLELTFVGSPGGTSPLAIYLNDTTRPSVDLAFVYGATSMLTGRPLVPLFSDANLSESVWGLSPGIAAVATLCPVPDSAISSCLSYNESAMDATPSASIESASFWNGTSGTYSSSYDAVATSSSTGACTIGPIECSGFSGPSGGFYPYWSLHNVSGNLAWQFGGSYPSELRAFDGPSAGEGTSPQWAPTVTVANLAGSQGGGGIFVSGQVADPAGVARVVVNLDYCSAPFGDASVSQVIVLGNAFSSSFGGPFKVFFTAPSSGGTYPFWVTAVSKAGQTTGPTFGSLVYGGATQCTFPAPATPSMVAGNISAIAGGYHLHWYDSDPAAAGYILNASAPNGSFELLRVGNVSAASWTLGGFAESYRLNVTEVNAVGTSSAPSATVSGPPTLGALTMSETRPLPSSFWLGSASLNATGAVSGGLAPYVVTLWAGDGSVTTNDSASGNFTLLHDFGGYWGTALVTLEATDAVGDVATLGPIAIQILATPLGVIQIASAGELVLNLSYSVPRSPVAPMTNYAIVMTTNPSLAWELEAGVTSNATVPGITVWNTTRAYLELDSPDGVTLYAQVLAVNYYGVGWLPEGNGTLTATPAALTMTPIVATPGGRAPFVDNVSASVTGGSNDTITNAIYSFPPDNIVTPTMQYVNGTTYLNASLTFPSPGTFVIVLHATDIFFGTAIETSIVYIAPGVAPAVSAQLVSLPAYVDAPLAFQAAATGGSGHYAWNWSFGDGNYSGLTNPIHSYAISGGYNVVLAVTDTITGGTNVTTLPIVVYALPVLFVSVTPGPNGSLSYDFHASVGGGSGASTIVWTFGDGGLARGVSVSHDYRATGTYLVNASATDPAGRSGTTEFNLSAFATTGSGTAPSSGLDSLDVTLIILATGFGVLALLLAVRRPAAPPPSEGESEDGEVSLT